MTRKSTHALGAILVMLALWQGLIWVLSPPAFILPSPMRVARAFLDNRALLLEHSLVTLAEVGLGLLLGTGFGILTALQLCVSRTARNLLRPILAFSQAIPVFALAPILTLWFGYGLASKVVMAVLIIYFPVTSAFFDGLMRVPPGYLDLAKTMGARPGAVLRHIRVPAAVPALGSGLKLAAVYAPIGAVIGEWVGASRGLGYLMLLANGRAKTDLMFAAVLVLGALSMALYTSVDRAVTAYLKHRET